MHLYNVTLQRAGAITQSIVGSFTGTASSTNSRSFVHEILVSRGKILELYKIDENCQLVSIYSQEVFGVIRTIQTYRYSGAGKDYVIVGSDSGRIVILEWQTDKNKFVKVHMETFGKTGCRRIVPGQHLAVDPKGRAVMISAIEKQKFVYVLNRDNLSRLTISSPLEAHKSHTIIYSTVPVDVGFDNPMFACLELDHGEFDHIPIDIEKLDADKQPKKMLTYYELDLGVNHVLKKWSVEVERTAHLLLSVPGGTDGPSGVLVFSENHVTYRHQSRRDVTCTIPRRDTCNLERGMMIVSGITYKLKTFFFLVQSEFGDLYKINLDVGGDGQVERINCVYFDTVPISSSINITKSGYLFVASEFGDHKLYQFTNIENVVSALTASHLPNNEPIDLFKVRALTNISLVQSIDSLSPIIDLKVHDILNEGTNQIIALCGRGPRSTLRILKHGLPVTELAKNEIGNPISVFSIKQHVNQKHESNIVISFSNYTLVLTLGDRVEQVNQSEHGMKENVATLATGLIGEDCLLQVHASGLLLLRPDKQTHEWDSDKKQVTRAAINQHQVVLALAGGEIIYFEYDPHERQLVEMDKVETGQDVVCLAVGTIPESKTRSRFMAAGFIDKTVRVYSLDRDDCMTILTRQALPSEPESIAICLMPSLFDDSQFINYLMIGLNNGIMIKSSMDHITGELSDTRTRFLGTKPVKLQKIRIGSNQNQAVLAMSTRSWLIYHYQSRMLTTPLSYSTLHSVASFTSEQCPSDGLLALGGNDLRVLTLDKLMGQMFTPNVIPLKYTPRRFVVSDRHSKLYVIESDHNSLSPLELEKVKSRSSNHDLMSMDQSGDDENRIENGNDESSESEIGCYRPLVNSGKWASLIRTFDPSNPDSTDVIELEENEAAFSLALVTFATNPLSTFKKSSSNSNSSSGDQFLIVGTAQDVILNPRSCSKSFLHVYKINESGQLQFVHKTQVDFIPTVMAEFKGRLLVGIGNHLRIYDLGKKKLLRKCENNQFPHGIQTLHVDGNRIYVGDVTESFHFVKYNRSENSLTIFADDTCPRWITAAVQLDYDTMAGADKFGNVFVLRLPRDVTEEMEDISGSGLNGNRWIWERGLLNGAPQKATMLVQFHVGEIVTCMVKTSLVRGSPQVIVYGTLSGGIGLLVPFAVSQDVEFFNLLEMHLREECPPLCGRDHLAYRSFYFPVKATVDGDLCELFLSLEVSKQRSIAEELRRTVADVAKKIEDMKNQSGF
ncbi:splicing factor 3B subunit 3 [Acrasis kona]|uniref:Splicing factor 3B subunit 3 n=1 Tax=Acrasis kona TaxID=1008807 RepID=A0AAW2YXZ3_9EUKA